MPRMTSACSAPVFGTEPPPPDFLDDCFFSSSFTMLVIDPMIPANILSPFLLIQILFCSPSPYPLCLPLSLSSKAKE